MENEDSEDAFENMKDPSEFDVPRWVLLIVVVSRTIYTGVTAISIFWIISYLTPLTFQPPISEGVMVSGIWLGAFMAVTFATTFVFFKVFLVLSWLTATIFYKPMRDEIIRGLKNA